MRAVLSAVLCLVLAACAQWPREEIVLPGADAVAAIVVTVGERRVECTDAEWIVEFLENARNAKVTDRPSIQDHPAAEAYWQIDLGQQTGTSVLFLYEENGSYYLEQPYQGIFETDEAVCRQVAALMDAEA